MKTHKYKFGGPISRGLQTVWTVRAWCGRNVNSGRTDHDATPKKPKRVTCAQCRAAYRTFDRHWKKR